MKKRMLALLLAAGMTLGATACAPKQSAGQSSGNPNGSGSGSTQNTPADPGEPQFGGTLRATINGDPTSLDYMIVNVEQEQIPASHIFETAIALDASGNPWPGVCNFTFENNVLTLTVREGVTFHNGDPCTIQDVEASFKRWTENVSAAKKQIAAHMSSAEVSGDSFVITFSDPAPVAVNTIAAYDNGLVILPKSLCEKYPDSKLADADCIGTGPYKFVEHLPDRYVKLERYDAYVPSGNTEATGMAAPRMAYADELYFYPVGDKTARITGVQTGEYDIGIGVPSNMMEQLSADPNLEVVTRDLGIFACMIFNNAQGPCTDKNLRNAILACLNMDDLMLAAQGSADLYRLNPGYMMTSSRWYVEESLGKYNNPDLDKAKEYLDASSYNGESLTFITTKEYDYFYKTALLVAESVKPIGIKIDVQMYDNSTLKEYRDDPTKYDIFSGGLSDKADPTQVVFLNPEWAGFWDNAEKDRLVEQLAQETDFDARYAIWTDICKLIYEEVPNITFGERINPIVYCSNVHNIFDTKEKYYWNTWLS